jgi:hypothetical protein
MGAFLSQGETYERTLREADDELGVENPGRLIKQALVAAIAAKKAETVGPDADGITEPDGEEVSADA